MFDSSSLILICLIRVFSVINVIIRGVILRGAEKERKQ